MTTVLITGAAGNLGSLLARHILRHVDGLELKLMEHRTPVPADLRDIPRVTVCRADLSRPETLDDCLQGVDVVVHFAGVLFRARPETFLPETNTGYFIDIGRVSYFGDTTRFRTQLLPDLTYPDIHSGISELDG